MGWVSYFEDIEKRTSELEDTIERIQMGEIPFIDGNRSKAVDIAKQIRTLVRDLEATIRRLGSEDGRVLGDILDLEERIAKLTSENEWQSNQLKKAFEQICKLREERDEDRKKFQFVVNKFNEGGITEVRRYLMSIRV